MPGEKPDNEAQAQPEPIAPRNAEDRFNAACRFKGTLTDIGVLWGPADKAVVKAPDSHGEQQITVGELRALQTVTIDENALMSCLVQVDLGDDRGVAGVGATARQQNPEGDSHPCAIAKLLAERIVERATR